MTLDEYRNARRALRLAGATARSAGKEGWLAAVKDQVRLTSSMRSHPTQSAPMRRAFDLLPEELQTLKLRAPSESLAGAERERADLLGDEWEGRCQKCDGSLVMGYRPSPGALAVAVPCDCVSLDERARRADIDARFLDATLERFEAREGKTAALAIALAWRGESVVFWGERSGTGKTHLGCGLLLKNLAAGLPARFTSVADLMDDLKQRFDAGASETSQAMFDRLVNEPVLMLDDLGAEDQTRWTIERVATLLDARYRKQLTTVITTNLSRRDIAVRYGKRVGDRLYEWRFVEVAGVSMRREAAMAGAR